MSTLFPEEAVNEVKRQAMSELQKAVAEAERKAHEMISSERAKMERTVAEAKRQAAEDALSIINQQEDSSEVGTSSTFKTGLADYRSDSNNCLIFCTSFYDILECLGKVLPIQQRGNRELSSANHHHV